MVPKKFLTILALYLFPAFSIPFPNTTIGRTKEPIPGQYIVILRDGVDRKAYTDTFPRRADGTSSITHEWNIINGFAGDFSRRELEGLMSHPDIVSIEKDGPVRPKAATTQ